MPQVVIVSALGPQGQVGPQGPSGSFDNISGSFLYTSSFNAFTESYNEFTASYNTGSFTGSFTGVSNLTSLSASSALVTGNVTVLGTASINTLIVNQTQLSTGSNQLGDAANDTQTLYGTVRIPTGSLTVSGSSFFTGSLNLGTGTVIYGDTTNPSLVLDQTTGAYLKYGTTSEVSAQGSTATLKASNTVQLRTGTTTHLFVSSSGNVGIGTSTPSTKLDVAGGDITVDLSRGIIFRSTSGYVKYNGSQLYNVSADSYDSNGYFRVRDNTGANTRFIVLDNGNVGIGTSTPSASIHIQKTTGSLEPLLLLDVNSLTTGSGAILRFNTSPGDKSIGSDIVGIRSGTAASSSLYFSTYPGSGTANVERMRITSDGNIGIGTSTPGVTLDVVGNIRANSFVFSSVTQTRDIRINSTDKLTFQNTSSAEVARFDNAGNWGFGVISPTAKLHVSGTIKIESTAAEKHLEFTRVGNNYISTANGGALLINVVGTAAENTSLFRVYPSAVMAGNGTQLTTATFNVKGSGTTSSTTALLVANSNASSSLAILDDGSVGIGTTTPTAKLEIKATGSNETIQRWLDNEGKLLGDFSEFSDAGVLRIGYVISSIATNRPLITLDGGAGNSSAGIYLRSKSATNNIRIASDIPSYISGSNLALGFINSTASAVLHISGTAAENIFRVDTPTVPYTLFVTGSGNVGIGTSTPTQKLEVNGAILIEGSSLDNKLILGANIAQTFSLGTYYNGFFDTFFLEYSAFGTPKILNIQANGNIGIGTTTPTASLHISGASSANLLRIDSPASSSILFVTGSGRVGIGTSTPAYLLDVSGSARINGTTLTNGLAFRSDGLTGIIPTNDGFNPANNGNLLRFTSNLLSLGSAEYGYSFINADSTLIWTSGIGGMIRIFNNYAPTSGTGQYRFINIEGIINQTGGASGTTRGLYINPTITSAASWRSIEWNNSAGWGLYGIGSAPNVLLGSTSVGQTAAPSARLHVVGSGTTSATTAFRVENANTSASMAILDNGNVGIGTTTPSYTLDVQGAAAFASPVHIGSVTSALTTSSGTLYLASSRLVISSSGNVGIGTTTPTSTLDIQSTTTGSIRISGSAGSQITLVRPTAGLIGYVRYLTGQMEIGTNSSDALYLNTLNTTRLVVQTNGDIGIGIGTGTPNARLHARGSGTTSATNTFRLENSSALPSLIVTDDLNSRFYGNVGIGAAAASGSLHISASASTSSAAVYIYKSGSTTLDIQGSQGQLFSVTDQLSGSLMSVNDISGLPILEVFSDDRVVMGSFASPALVVTGSAVRFPATGSAAPTYSGSNGETIFTVIGGNAFMYVWLGGRWRSGSLA